jgi:uncharacterized glyoxalase superfamily protein PhnB
MSDPFDALRRPDAPIAPSATFAKRLRRQLEAELRALLTPATSTPDQNGAIRMTVTPYFNVHDAAAALDFYRDAFGAIETHRLVGTDGRIGHAEMVIGTSTMMLADEYPEVGALSPQTLNGTSCSFRIDVGEVDRVDAVYRRAIELGATSIIEPADQFYGDRSAMVRDPFGQRWSITAKAEDLAFEEYEARAAAQTDFGGGYTVATADRRGDAADAATDAGHDHQIKHHEQGDLYYFSIPTADLARAQRFYGAVVGWRFRSADNGHIENISAPPGSVSDKADVDAGVRLWIVVDDIHAAIERVRAAGGSAAEPVNYESGWSVDCVDDQGIEFSLTVPTYTR